MNQEYLDTYLPVPTTFEVDRILRTAWARFKLHWFIWVPIPVMTFAFGSIPAVLDTGIDLVAGSNDDAGLFRAFAHLAISVLSTVVAVFFEAGFLRMVLSSIRGGPVRLGDLFSGGRFVLRLVLAQSLLVLATGAICAPILIAGAFSQSMVVMLPCVAICAVPWLAMLVGFAFTPSEQNGMTGCSPCEP